MSLSMLTQKQKIYLGVAIVAVICIIFYYIFENNSEYNYDELEEIGEKTENISQSNIETEKEEIVLHITGAVKQEGIVRIEEGARIIDVVEAAGGLQENADLKNVNLAYVVEDGQKIYIPYISEEDIGVAEEIPFVTTNAGENTIIDEGTTSNTGSNLKVNINKATQADLQLLPGIGESTAAKIIEHREKNGKFSSIEEIKNVSGIGDAKYENIKDYISI